MEKLSIFVACVALVFGSALASPDSSLRLVSVLYRHGDRSPITVYPKDINQVGNAWPEGLGWLTNIGKMQQYQLGQYIKQRYHGFLNTSFYNHEEIYIEASAENRCLMSAYSNLAGLFPPMSAQLWNPQLKWQPIPVQTRPKDMDNKLAENAPCPKYDELFQELLNSPAIKEEEKTNKEFYAMIEENTGIKREWIGDIWGVADTLVCEKAHNLTWNKWVYAPGVWDKINELRTFSFDLLFNSPAMARLKGGPLLKEIISNMQAATKTEAPMPKFYMYSAHDTTVASLLKAMHVFNLHQPIYRALVMVELHEIQEDYVVKIFYRNNTLAPVYELLPPGCSDPCTLAEFIEVTRDTVPLDWEEECKVEMDKPVGASSQESSDSLSPASWVALSLGVALCVVIIAALGIFVARLRRPDTVIYSRLC